MSKKVIYAANNPVYNGDSTYDGGELNAAAVKSKKTRPLKQYVEADGVEPKANIELTTYAEPAFKEFNNKLEGLLNLYYGFFTPERQEKYKDLYDTLSEHRDYFLNHKNDEDYTSNGFNYLDTAADNIEEYVFNSIDSWASDFDRNEFDDEFRQYIYDSNLEEEYNKYYSGYVPSQNLKDRVEEELSNYRENFNQATAGANYTYNLFDNRHNKIAAKKLDNYAKKHGYKIEEPTPSYIDSFGNPHYWTEGTFNTYDPKLQLSTFNSVELLDAPKIIGNNDDIGESFNDGIRGIIEVGTRNLDSNLGSPYFAGAHEAGHNRKIFNSTGTKIGFGDANSESPYYGFNYSFIKPKVKKLLTPINGNNLNEHDKEVAEQYSDLMGLRADMKYQGIADGRNRLYRGKDVKNYINTLNSNNTGNRYLYNHVSNIYEPTNKEIRNVRKALNRVYETGGSLPKPFSYYPIPTVRYDRGGKLYAEGSDIDEDYNDESKWTKHTGHWDINDSNRETITEQKLIEEALNRGITNMKASSQYDDAGNVIGIDAEYYTPVQSSFKRPTHDEIHFVQPNAKYSTDGTPVNMPSDKVNAEVADTDLLQLNPQDIVPTLDARTAEQREIDELTRLGFTYADTIKPSYISAQAPSINTLQGRRAAQNIYDRAKSNPDANVGIPQSYNTYMQAMPLQDTVREGANDFAFNYAYPTLAALATPMAFNAAAPVMQLMDPRFYGALVERFGPQVASKIISNPAVLNTFINTAIPALSGTAQIAAASAIDIPMLYHGITGLGKDAKDYLNHEYEWNQLPQTAMNAMGLMAAKPLAGFAKGIYNAPIPEFNSSELRLLSNNNRGKSLKDIITEGKNTIVKKYEDLRGITADQAVVDNIRKRENDAWEEVKKTSKAARDAHDKQYKYRTSYFKVWGDPREDVNLGKVAAHTKNGAPLNLETIDSDSDVSVNSFDNFFKSVLGEHRFQSTESSVGSGVAEEHELSLDFSLSGNGRESIVAWKPYAGTAEVPSKVKITQPRINFSGRNPKEITSQIKSYVDFINQKLNVGGVQKGIVGGSSILYANGFGVGVPHDLEIITTEDNLDDVIRILEVVGINKNHRNRANTITGGKSKWSIETFDSKTGKNGGYDIDIQVLEEDPNTKEALGINTHETLRAIKPELYYDWAQAETKDAVEKSISDITDDSRKLSELLVTNPDTGKPFTSQEIFNLLADGDNMLTKTLCDQFWAEPNTINKGKQVMRVITYMTSPDVSAEQFIKIQTASMRASVDGYKSVLEDCPNIDYKDVEANKEFLRSIGMPSALASDEEIMKKIAASYYQYASLLNRSVWINDPKGKSIFSFKDFLNSVVAVQQHHGGNASGEGGNNTAFGTWAGRGGGYGKFFSVKQLPIKNGTKVTSTSQLFDYYNNQNYDRELTDEEINKIFSELGFTAKSSDGSSMSVNEAFETLYGQEDKIKKLSDVLNISYLRNKDRTVYDEYRGNVSSYDTEDTFRMGVYVGETPEQGGLFKRSKVNSLEKTNSQIIREEKPISDKDVTTLMQATTTLPKKESDDLYNLEDAEDSILLDIDFKYGNSDKCFDLNDPVKSRQAALSLGIPESEWRDAYSKLKDIQDQKNEIYKRVHDLYNEFFEIVNDTKLSDDERAEKLVEYLELHNADIKNTIRSQKGLDLMNRYEDNTDKLVQRTEDAEKRARDEHKKAQSDEGIALHLESKIRAKKRKDAKIMKGLASTMAIVAGYILLKGKIKNAWIPSDSTPLNNSENEKDNE